MKSKHIEALISYVDFAVPDRGMVSEYIEKVREFHTKINEYIQTQQQISKD